MCCAATVLLRTQRMHCCCIGFDWRLTAAALTRPVCTRSLLCPQGNIPHEWLDASSGQMLYTLEELRCDSCSLSGSLPAWQGPAGLKRVCVGSPSVLRCACVPPHCLALCLASSASDLDFPVQVPVAHRPPRYLPTQQLSTPGRPLLLPCAGTCPTTASPAVSSPGAASMSMNWTCPSTS
jgi:hypothetical protein